VLSETSLVLVCLLPNPRDFEISRLLGWYRIPLRSAPKLISVDYLAFYQPLSFGEGKNQIEFVAEVRGNELTIRANLLRDEADHPNAKEEYYKIQIGNLERLKNPIKAESWKRITFLYTTGEYLLQAKVMNDLIVRSDERQTLWKSLRERSSLDQTYQAGHDESEMDENLLAVLLGIKDSL
jgi:hypothetical protein